MIASARKTKVHERLAGLNLVRCGRFADEVESTADLAAVTCGRCRRVREAQAVPAKKSG